MLRARDAVKERWMKYFEGLINVKSEGETIVTCVGRIGCGGKVYD